MIEEWKDIKEYEGFIWSYNLKGGADVEGN